MYSHIHSISYSYPISIYLLPSIEEDKIKITIKSSMGKWAGGVVVSCVKEAKRPSFSSFHFSGIYTADQRSRSAPSLSLGLDQSNGYYNSEERAHRDAWYVAAALSIQMYG